MGGEDVVLNILTGVLYVAAAAADVAVENERMNRRIDRRIAKRERRLERQNQRSDGWREARVESRIKPSQKRSPRPIRMPAKTKTVAKPVKIKRNIFSEEDLKPNQNKIPQDKYFKVCYCDVKKLRGPLIHDVSKEWRCQPAFIIHSGFMQKTGEYNSSYKRRFFILTSKQELHYYKLNHDSDVTRIASKDYIKKQARQFHKGTIQLKKFKSVDVRSKNNEFRLCSWNAAGRDFLFKCDDAMSVKKWILIIRATCAAAKDPWKVVDGEDPPDAPINYPLKSESTANPQITPNFFSHVADPTGKKSSDIADEPLDDIAPMYSEYVDSIPNQGPGYTPAIVEPSAPTIFEGIHDDNLENAPSAPPPAYEDVCPGAANFAQFEGVQTGTHK